MSTPPSRPKRSRDACPLCGKPSQVEFAPFCSQGCRDRDLLNWLGDAYRVPGAAAQGDGFGDGLPQEGLDSEGEPSL